MSNIEIYVVCHKSVHIPKCEYLLPIQVGAALNKKIKGILHDNEGKNISEKNPDYCELTGLYWAWKNSQASYIGLFHYRRFLNFKPDSLPKYLDDWKHYYHLDTLTGDVLEKIGYYDDSISQIVNDFDIVIPKKSNLLYRNRPTYYSEFAYYFRKELDYTFGVVKEFFPNYEDAIEESKQSPYGYHCNISIMKKDIFNEYCTFMFTVLDKVYEDIREGKLLTEKKRLIGYLAEYLTGIYILHKKDVYKIKELDGVTFNYTDGKKHRFHSIIHNTKLILFRLCFPLGSQREKIFYSIVDKIKGYSL